MSEKVPNGTATHRAEAAQRGAARCGVLTVSDSRTLVSDESGPLLRALLTAAGHTISVTDLLPNDEPRVRALVEAWTKREDVDAVIITGGTGLGSRDRSVEAVRPLLDKEIPGFGELFRLFSYQDQVGTSAILSRALAGSANRTLVVVLPGSKAAVELATTRILVPELAHLLREIGR